MGYYTGKALIRRRTGQPAVNIVSEYKSFRRQSDGSILPDSIKLTAEIENIGEPTYEWFVIGANESGGRKWVKIENSNYNTYNVSPPELNADGEESWTKKTFKVTVTNTSQAVVVSDSVIIEVEEPIEVGGVNLLTRDNWEQGSLNKQAPEGSSYSNLKIDNESTTVIRVIELVSVGYNHVYSIGNSEYEYAYVNFLESRTGGAKYPGTTYFSDWLTKSSFVRRPRSENNYVAVLLRRVDGGAITVDDFEKSKLKLENGTVDTDWTPAPSDLEDLFLSKVNPDTAQESITFLKGLTAEQLAKFLEGIVTKNIKSPIFTPGLLGEGFIIDKDGNAVLESLELRALFSTPFILLEDLPESGITQGITELTEDLPESGIVQGITELTEDPEPETSSRMSRSLSPSINQRLTEVSASSSGIKTLGDLQNVDETFDTVPDAVYSFRKQDGIYYPILGGGSTSARLALTYITPAAVTVVHSMPFVIEYMFSSLIDGEETGAGSVTYRVNNRIVGGTTINQGTNTFDVSRHLILGDSTVIISVTDSYGNTRTLNYRITAVNVQLTSTFNANQIFNSIIPFRFTPFGFGQMVIHILVDGEQIGEVMTSTSNRQQNYNIPKQTHGAHIIEAYMTIDRDGDIITSNRLRYSVISIEQGNNDTIISSPFVSEEMKQFDTILIPFTVYNPLSANAEIEMLVNGRLEQTRIVDRTQQHWSYNLTESGEVTLQIKAGSVIKSFVIDVAESSIADLEESEAMQLKLISAGRSSSESDRDKWEYGNIKSKFTGFNWTSNGWAIDDNGSSYLKVSGDAKLDIPFKIFDTDFKLNGKTFEIVFFTEDVSNLNYVVLSCMQGGKGFEITSQSVIFKSEQSSITTQFKENELIRISISVEQLAKNRLISLFINGILSGVVQYPTSDSFTQANPVNITAQGLEATIGIYAVRVYNTDLQAWQILNNYIFDYPVARERELIYMRNNILGAGGDISYARLVEQLPCLIITGDLPQHKGDKKTSDIEFEDRQNPERSFTATNVQNDVQGTSSQYYPRKNYKMKFNSGFNMSDGSHKDGFQTHEDTLPATVFTHKADFAESSGTHNTGLAKVMEGLLRTLNIKTPPQLVNDKVRTTIDGFAIAIFHRQNPEDTPVFIGKYNFNTDKAAENTFGFDTPVECWEIRNNTSRRVLFKESDYEGDEWLKDFEGRFPEDNTNPVNLKRMTDWVVSCIGNPTKFRAEFSQYFHQDFMLSYWILTELFGMVDQRAKNVFWTTFDTKIWLPIFYDNDTVLGINNEGANAFYFDIEIHDKIGTQDVWNGADSELWRLVEQAFPNELVAMYQRIRANNTLSYDSVLSILNGEHSDRWAETVYNEDGQFKYIDPLLVDGNGSYLYAAQGSREEHRKWWLYNRFRYMDSKYNTGDFKSDYITMRLYAPSGDLAVEPNADFTVTTFGSHYIRAKWGSYETSQRVKLGEEVTFESPDITFNDTETILYGASYLKTIGDLSGKYAGTVDISKGTQLTELIIGNSTPGYVNTNLHVLTAGNNKLLRKINIENCPNLIKSIDLSGCIGLEEVYAKGSGITGISLSKGGEINILSLPATLNNLTLIGQPIRQTGLQLEGYGELSSLHIDKCPNLNSYTLAKDILSRQNALQNIRLIDIDATDVNIDTLIAMSKKRGIDENGFTTDTAVITGKIHVGEADSYELSILNQKLPYLTITYDVLTITPMRIFTITNASDGMSFEELDVYINDELYHPDESGKIEIRSGSALTVLIEKDGYLPVILEFGSTTSYTNYSIQLVPYVKATITVINKSNTPINGALVHIQGKTVETVDGLAIIENLTYELGTELKVSYGNKTHIENIDIGYNDFSKTVVLDVILPPTPNGNPQMMVTTSRVKEIRMLVRGWEGQNAQIDWGDGSPLQLINSNTMSHTYTDVGLFNIEIKNATNLTLANVGGVRSNGVDAHELVAYWAIGDTNIQNVLTYDSTLGYFNSNRNSLFYVGDDVFKNDSNRTDWSYVFVSSIISNIPTSFEQNNKKATTFSACFYKCSSLTAIPSGLFDNCTAVMNFSYCFYDCSSLTAIPSGLFDNCTAVTDFRDCFNNCSSLTTIPSGLFDNCTAVTSFNSCFYYCRSLTTIPQGLFDNCTAVTSFVQCFRDCTSLTTIPSGLFDNCTAVTSFNSCFYYCSSLTTIPSGLFDNCTAVINFRECFRNCSSLTTIPSGLFDDCTAVTNFNTCFMGCSSLTTIPQGLFDNCTAVTDITQCFRDCSSLTTIPSGLFDNCIAVTTFQACFNNCRSLTTIPSGLFDNCIAVTTFQACFNNCRSLTTIPSGLFDDCTAVTIFSQCFYYCSSLTTIPQGLFDKCTAVTNFSSCFNNCTSLTTIPSGLFDDCTAVTIFSQCFQNCSSLTTIPSGLFDNCTAVTTFYYCFAYCSSLTTIPSGLFDNCTVVIDFYYCFNSCTSLTTIPSGLFDNCTAVETFESCFQNCSSLVYCEIPQFKIDSRKGGYLSGATLLSYLKSNSTTPPTITTNTIPNNTNLKIYVPDASVNAYKTATNWSVYTSKIYPLSEYEN